MVCAPALGIESWRLGVFGEDPPTCGMCFILVKVLVVNLNGNIVTSASPHWWLDTTEIQCAISRLSVFHFGEHRAAPTETSFHWEVNFGINHRLQVPRYFYTQAFTYATYFVIAIELEVIYIAIT